MFCRLRAERFVSKEPVMVMKVLADGVIFILLIVVSSDVMNSNLLIMKINCCNVIRNRFEHKNFETFYLTK